VESLDRGRELSVPIGDGTEVLAATWSAIGRLRAHLASRSGGRIHFREREGAAATLALVDDEPALEGAADVSLRDRRILIADDDPAVLWFFANLLKEAGAIPEEASDGEEALRLARKSRPDVIIADILMPRLDGFSLTRELKRDPVLSDVPVVLLSWKEDFLQRMRELSAGASGYLRKEAGSAQILAAVREVLRPRARLEQRLRAGGDVRGRLERIGVIPLLQTTAQHRPDARITVRDAWNLFEVDLRRPRGSNTGEETGHIVDITRTASDGSFSRGPRVVMALLGAFEGRFTVADADAPVRASVREPLDKLVERSASELGGLVDAVSGRGLLLAWRVEFDEDVLASILRSAPPTVAAVVDALRRGRGPRSLVVDGTFAPQDLERVLVDLARQGAITAVLGEGNDDRVAAARRDRGETALPVRTPSLAPPAHAAPAPSKPDDTSSVPGLDLSWAKSEEATADIVRETLKAPEEKLAAKATSKPPLAVPPPKNDDDDDEPELVVARASDPDALEEAAAEEASARPVSITVGTGRPPPPLPPEGEASDELEAQPPRSPSLADLLEPSQSSAGFVVPPDDEDDAEREPETKATAPAEEPAEKPKSEKGPEKTEEKAEKKAKPKPKPAAEPTPPAPPPKPAEPGGLGAFTWTFLLVFLAFAGFAGWRLTHPSVAPTPPPQPTPQPAPPSVPASVAPSVEPPTDTSDPSGADEAPPSSAVAPTSSGAFASYGRAADGIDPAFDIAVPAGQGLLVLQPGAEPYTIRMGQEPAVSRRVDHDPIAIAFPEGIVDLAFIRGDGTSFRFAYVESGHTRYVAPPE
jgi:CheY-like chemotaxis protein